MQETGLWEQLIMATEAVTGRMATTADHFLLTRFNVRSFYHAAEPTDEWLQNRLDLFEGYCLPSVKAQTDRDFTWLVFLDHLSPAWFRGCIEELARDAFVPVYVEGAFTAETVSSAIRERSEAPYVLTTRLDNDDAIARDFIGAIQQCFDGQDFEFINLVNGAQYAAGKAYLRPYTKNPFLTLIEKAVEAPPSTVFVEHHYRVDERGPVRNVRTSHPMWLQVIHGGNVLNDVVGLRVPGKALAGHFGCGLEFEDGFPGLALDLVRDTARIVLRLAKKPGRVGELFKTLVAGRPAGSG